MLLTIPTARLLLREYRRADRAQFLTYQTDPRFTVFHHPDELGAAPAERAFDCFIDWQQQAPRRNFQLAIVPRDDDQSLLGSVGIRLDGCAAGEAVFGIELARPWWGRYRYAHEAGIAMIDWAFKHLALAALLADTAFENGAVTRLAEAAGFTPSGAADKQCWRLERATWQRRRDSLAR